MFYSQFILAKKGPLGTIWIAAHLERKLRKNQVADTDIGVSVDSILFPDVPIALRLSSHLLLGVVRIYSRKVNYLFDDCSEALLKIKQAFRSTAVDLPPEESTAPYHSITLPETFDLDDFELPDNDIFQGNYVDHHVSSREQITLQDTMEGVVYSNSQFGLDERFGDGDASQIGLDLDEVLLTDKAATLEHDDSNAGPQVSHQKDEVKEEVSELCSSQVKVRNPINIDDFPDAAEAEGPSTPGLEEPNLLGAQVDQVNNEAANDDLADFMSMKSQNDSVAHERENDIIDSSLQNNVKQNGEDFHHENSDSEMVDMDKEKEEQDHLEGMTTDQENLIPNNHGSEAIANETVAPPSSHVTSDQENPSDRLLSKMDWPQEPESDGHLEDVPSLSKDEVLDDREFSKPEGNLSPVDEAKKSIVTSPVGSPSKPPDVDVEVQPSQELMAAEALNHDSHEAEQPTESLLRPCSSHLTQPSPSHVEGEKCHETDVPDPALGYQEPIEPFVSEGNLDLGKSDEQLGSKTFSDKEESIEKSAASVMPEPEKLLSLPYQHDGEVTDMLLESTPDNQGVSDSHTGADRGKGISGKKRSFTESTLTMQSNDLLESYGGAQSKRSRETVPDDDDLLSSILVGRRSSVLKMKPSPAVPELASTKRFRNASATRPSVSKRKVLLDDTMVLHGDTIRQQLTSTEDIRRIRKKAPCTRHEIIMIQRQFLEDVIFSESIFTGWSPDLVVLQSGRVDFSGIKVIDDGLDSSVNEKTNDLESLSRTMAETHDAEGNVVPVSVQPQEVAEVQPNEISVLSENHQSEVNLGSHDIDAHEHFAKEPHGSQDAEMNNAGVNIEISEAENLCVAPGPGHESSSLTELVENNPVADKTNDLVDSIHSEMGIPSDQNLNTSILEEGLAEDKVNKSGVDAIEIAEHSMEVRTEVQTDGLEDNGLCAPLTAGPQEANEYPNNQASFNGDLPTEENCNKNEDQIAHDKDTLSGCIVGENTEVDRPEFALLVSDEKEGYLNDTEHPLYQEDAVQSTTWPETSAIKSPYVDHNEENVMIPDDTGFLNVDDDEMIDDDDDYVPEGGADLSGWSSRTRAVAKYLQILFEKDDLNGRQNIHLDNLLAGKTRKEASRMFFETLVLKTRDYVHVEQPKPFANINLKPRTKLMKSDF
ncbi:sister chromatid cohesion 1 protein 4 isoform X1 [Arachis hypogaea]|uniref:sister chromatid cohesion 1 protein 4 isoform X1 n=1 Tax=Arachis hypogaea TaxID=3818 RepID=UPI000DECB3F1|nr:sister chromatid cohesion 1 protein 4 isoform X1 [Arachis hypogaea]